MVDWYLHDLKTGRVLADLPLRPTGVIERTISKPSTLGVELDIHDPSCPPTWVDLFDPRRAMIVADHGGAPLVGYVIDNDTAGDPSASFSLNSLESVLDAAYCRTHDFTEGVDDEAVVAATLLSDVIGPSFGFDIQVTPTGRTADHSYAFEEDRTVLSALTDLTEAEGGPEWTIRLAWEDPTKRNRIIKTIHIGPRIGSDLTDAVVVENIHLQSRLRKRSSARGDLATYVIATSDGSGPSRPMSDAHVDALALDSGVPQWEARVHITAVDDPDQLDRYAEAGLLRRRLGITTWEMVLAQSTPGCPQVGHDFDAGDTVTIESPQVQHDPTSWVGAARIIGWRAALDAAGNLSTVTPVFWQQPEEGAS